MDTPRIPASSALSRFRERAGKLSMKKLADLAGYKTASGVQRYLSPDNKDDFFPLEIVDKFAKALVGKGDPPITQEEIYLQLGGIHPSGLVRLALPSEETPELIPNATLAPDAKIVFPIEMEDDIALIGTAAMGGGGDFRLNGETVGKVPRFNGIKSRKGIFAIYARGDSMTPWRQPGAIVYVDSIRPPREGDHVVVECVGEDGEAGDAFLKRLVSQNNDVVRLSQYNPATDKIEIPASKVRHIYKVIEWEELIGLS